MNHRWIAAVCALFLIVAAGRPLSAQSTDNVSGTFGELIVNGSGTQPTLGVLVRPKTAGRPWSAVQTGSGDQHSGFLVLRPDGTELLRVRGDGVIGLDGTTGSLWGAALSPSIEHKSSSISFGDIGDILVTSNAYSNYSGQWIYKSAASASNYYQYDGHHHFRVAAGGAAGAQVTWRYVLSLTPAGEVGVGTEQPDGGSLRVVGTSSVYAPNSGGFGVVFKDPTATEGLGSGVLMEMQGNSLIQVSGLKIGRAGLPVVSSTAGDLYLTAPAAKDVIVGEPGGAARLRVTSSGVSTTGNVVVGAAGTASHLTVAGTGTSTFAGPVSITGGLTVQGDITGTRVLNAVYRDFAEWVDTDEKLSDGTVVVVAPDKTDQVIASTTAYDTRVAGVVSPQPGVLLGIPGEAKVKVATTGRVRVRVDASVHPIAIGDLLVSSAKAGVAMKSIPLDLGGVPIHRPGTLIGKALEPLPSGEGEILVLLSLQ